MATMTRARLSINNKYYIDKHRYYELKHFCLQYNIWKRAYNSIDGLSDMAKEFNDPTPRLAEKRISYLDRMKMIEQAAIETDPELYSYILRAVTEGLSYVHLKTKLEIPCGKDLYYERYRRFFWILDNLRE